MPIVVNGRRLEVTKNLDQAMVDLRDACRPIEDSALTPCNIKQFYLRFQGIRQELRIYGSLLWTHAICINQGDEDEKKRQIRRMGYIYSASKRVIIYTNPSDAFQTTESVIERCFRLAFDISMDM
jgi:hypothetical protein